MLVEGRLMKEISSELRFSSPARFCVRFQRRFGVCPSGFLDSRRAVRLALAATQSSRSSDGIGPRESLGRLQARAGERLRAWESIHWPRLRGSNVREAKANVIAGTKRTPQSSVDDSPGIGLFKAA
jgi:AraC-like DNA-binding protein